MARDIQDLPNELLSKIIKHALGTYFLSTKTITALLNGEPPKPQYFEEIRPLQNLTRLRLVSKHFNDHYLELLKTGVPGAQPMWNLKEFQGFLANPDDRTSIAIDVFAYDDYLQIPSLLHVHHYPVPVAEVELVPESFQHCCESCNADAFGERQDATSWHALRLKQFNTALGRTLDEEVEKMPSSVSHVSLIYRLPPWGPRKNLWNPVMSCCNLAYLRHMLHKLSEEIGVETTVYLATAAGHV